MLKLWTLQLPDFFKQLVGTFDVLICFQSLVLLGIDIAAKICKDGYLML